MQGFLELNDGLLHMLLAKIEIGHDLMVRGHGHVKFVLAVLNHIPQLLSVDSALLVNDGNAVPLPGRSKLAGRAELSAQRQDCCDC